MLKNLRILLLTGEKSYDEIKQVATKTNQQKHLRLQCDVIKAPVDVSAFMQTKHVISLCAHLSSEDYDIILVPGFTTWDTSELLDKVSIPVYKGTRFSGDLFDLLVHIREVQLPTKKAADYLLRHRSQQKIEKHIKMITEIYYKKGQTKTDIRILRFAFPSGEQILTGGKFPPLLISEIVDIPKLSETELMNKIDYFIASGANVIDLGMIFGESHPNLIRKIIPFIKKKYDVLVSIDSVKMEEIIAGIESGVDIILSIDGENIQSFLDYALENQINRDLGLVLVPLEGEDHKAIEDAENKAKFLIELAKKLTAYGFNNIFYDALLKSPISPGLMDSLHAYYILNAKLRNFPELHYPTFLGLHNVFELVDVDTSGMIALLTLLASELDCAGVFTTEFSPKTLGSIRDTKKSIDLAYLAKISKSPPTNLGLDGFNVKSKRKSIVRTDHPSIIVDLTANNTYEEKIQKLLDKKYEFIHDSTGYFKIYVNHETKMIEALFLPFKSTKEKLGIAESLMIVGKTAESIYKTIDKLGLIEEISHAFYVGKELSKAEYALNVNAAYFEDTELE
jgi:dihydropteroate synthase-like protein